MTEPIDREKPRDLGARLQALSPERRRLLRQLQDRIVSREPRAAAPAAAPISLPFGLLSSRDRERLPGALDDAYPLAAAQLGMLHHMELTPDDPTPAYHNVNSFHLRGRFAQDLFDRAVQVVVARHPILRTSFDLTRYSEPLQLVHSRVRLPVRVVDLRSLDPAERQAEVDRFVERDNRELFDLGRPPLVRLTIHLRSHDTFQLTLTEPHAISDGWSTTSTLAEVFEHYLALLRGEAPPDVPMPSVTYRDFVALERQVLESEEAKRFWRAKLADPPPVKLPRLPRDPAQPRRPMPRKPEFPIDPQVTAALRRLARGAGLPLKSVLLAAHLKAMSLLTGGRDVVTGISLHGRPESVDGERVRGLFLNTLPLRLKLPRCSWEELARHAFEAEAEVMPYRRYPLASLQKVLGDQTPFEAVFGYLRFHSIEAVLRSGDVEILDHGNSDLSVTHFPLMVIFIAGPLADDNLSLMLEHDDAEIAPDQIDTIHGYYDRILQAMAADASADHTARCFLGPAERRRVLERWSGSVRPYPAERAVEAGVELQAERTPDAVAVTWGATHLSYRELDRRATRRAGWLAELGVLPDDRVGVCLGRSPELMATLLAVLKAGAAYVPLDPLNPPERLREMVRDAGVDLMVAGPEHEGLLVGTGARVVPMAAEAGALSAAGLPASIAASGDRLACLLYTSGSTGVPKAAALTHRAVNRLVLGTDYVVLEPRHRVAQGANVAFDAALFEIWGALLSGAALVLVPQEAMVAPRHLVEEVERHRISTLFLTTALFNQVVREAPAGLGSLEHLLFGGETVDPAAVRGLLREAPPEALLHGYGPTESTTFATCHRVTEAPAEGQTVPIGGPIANTSAYVLDQDRHPLPTGVAGELHLGGDGLARGYWDRPALTAARFVPDPVGGRPGRRLYRTGDLARFLPGGALEFGGRSDHQVKLRGFRIELGEVEAALADHPAVRQAIVVTDTDALGQKRLVGYVVADPERQPPAHELRSFLRRRLPDYMVPAAFVVLASLPLNPHGKVDRRALPRPAEDRPELDRPYVAPRTERERVLAEVWAEVLDVRRVGIHDDFFELGGDSIRGLIVVSRSNQRGIGISSRELFHHPTIAELSRCAGTSAAAEAATGPVTGEAPLTPVQRWFFDLDPADRHHFNQAFLFGVAPSVEPSRVAAAVTALARQHDALRLRFVRTPDGWRQHLLPPGRSHFPLHRVDLEALPASRRPPAVETGAARVQAALDPESGPIGRVALFRVGGGEPDRLLMAIHHLAVDGVSWRILLEDLVTLLAAEGDRRPELPARTASFRDWARRLHEAAAGRTLEAEIPYWRGVGSSEDAVIPVDLPGGENRVGAARGVTRTLDRPLTQGLLHGLPARLGARVQDALLAALVRACGPWTGRDSLVVDLEGHGRDALEEELDVSRTVGWFTAIYPVRLRCGAEEAPEVSVRAVADELARVPRGGTGYGMLRHGGDPARAAALAGDRSAVSFNYLGHFDRVVPESAPLLGVPEDKGPVQSPRAVRPYLLDVTAHVAGGKLIVTWTYGSSLHRRETIEGLADRCVEFLRELAATLDRGGPEAGEEVRRPDPAEPQDELDRALAEVDFGSLDGFEAQE